MTTTHHCFRSAVCGWLTMCLFACSSASTGGGETAFAGAAGHVEVDASFSDGSAGGPIDLHLMPVGSSDSSAGALFDASLTQIVDSQGVVQPTLDVGTSSCTDSGGVLGPLARKCAAATANECAGASDVNPAFPNGAYGNGYDDDCDGIVDEGCHCGPDHPVGTTRTCSLTSSSQVDLATKQPVGWCTQNSVGTQKCVLIGNEFPEAMWDGECRGAQPPYADDVCAKGDFDCDGIELNSRSRDCACKIDVSCPSDPIVTQPYPNVSNLLEIDATKWATDAASAKAWKWTVTGGDCDNILPHPTFAVYSGKSIPAGAKRISSDTPQQSLGLTGKEHGFVINQAGPKVYPAFALSGDYLVRGEWDDLSGHHGCTVKVQVRAPGIRAELCWAPMHNDLDLHVARLQNTACKTHGWFNTCAQDERTDDCYYLSTCSGSFPATRSTWGYAQSPQSACVGWGSTRASATCDNPRLDQDNIDCDPAVADPSIDGGGGVGSGGLFCAPENINIDNPNNGDKFVVGVAYYAQSPNDNKAAPVRPHVNVYCNGVRKLALGLDPQLPTSNFPVLRTPGADTGGDLWQAATVESVVDSAGKLTDCNVVPIHSTVVKATNEGSRDFCVDTNPHNAAVAAKDDMHWTFTATGGYPASTDAFCWH